MNTDKLIPLLITKGLQLQNGQKWNYFDEKKPLKADDTKNVTNSDTKKLTERQRVILEMLPIDDTKNVTKKERVNTVMLAARFGVVLLYDPDAISFAIFTSEYSFLG